MSQGSQGDLKRKQTPDPIAFQAFRGFTFPESKLGSASGPKLKRALVFPEGNHNPGLI
jgi:hypothetical protein